MELVTVNKEIEATRAEFNAYVEKTNKLCSDALAITVTNDEQAHYAITLGGAAKAILKEIDGRRKETTANAAAFIEAVNGMCKILTEPLKQAEATTKKKVGDYQTAMETERRRQEEAARQAAAELQEKLRRETEEANRKAMEEARLKAEDEARQRNASTSEITAASLAAQEKAISSALEAPVVLSPIIPMRPASRTESGTLAYQVKSWKFEIVDADIVPRQYLIVDEKKIREAVDMGLRNIQGVNIYEHIDTRFRNRKVA